MQPYFEDTNSILKPGEIVYQTSSDIAFHFEEKNYSLFTEKKTNVNQ